MSSAQKTYSKQIAKAETVEECESLLSELDSLQKKATEKKRDLEEAMEEAGLAFRGRNAFQCDCGNSVKKHGPYIGKCHECEETVCKTCLVQCSGCGNTVCDPCAMYCKGCGDTLCDECCLDCDHCNEQFCEDCLQYTCTPVDENGVCPDCFDYIQHINELR